MARFRSFWAKFWGCCQNNAAKFIMLGLALLLLWFLVSWITFRAGWLALEEFRAYATFGTAVGTTALALATVYMVRQNRELVKQNHIMLETPRIREVVLLVINPLLKSMQEIKGQHEKREYMWVRPDLQTAKKIIGDEQALIFQFGKENAFLPHPWIIIEENTRTFQQLHEAVYRDFRKMQPSLTTRIEEHDIKSESFRHLLIDLAEEILCPRFKELVETWRGLESKSALQKLTLSTACLTFNKLLGASEEFSREQVKDEKHRDFWKEHEDFVMEDLISANSKDKVQQIIEEAHGFVEKLKGIEAALLKIKDGYQKDYHLTHEETEATNKGTSYLT